MKTRFWLTMAVLLVLSLAVPGSAQEETSTGVARVSLIHGDISTQRGDSGDWSAAALNAPLVAGDKVSAGERSRTEVQLDYANVLRLGDNSEATIAELTRTSIQVHAARGLIELSVLKGSEAEVEIDTPNVAVRPRLKDGVYRIEVDSSETRVIVRKGEAEISTPQGSARVEKGRLAVVRGSGEDTQYKIADAPAKDNWDSWNSERDGAIRNAQSWRHTNRYYVGAEDLDASGTWTTAPDYGPVWIPTVGIDWAPYRAGRWVWQPYWGWTWVSYEPWGWAPYHYGRWFLYGSSWAWWPGPAYGAPYYRPVWAPAYVSFFGFGGGFGISLGFGSVGWIPIGPCDYYHPWYGRHGSRFNTVNITNITNITNIYNVRGQHGIPPLRTGNRYSNLRLINADERMRQAVSTVPADRFGTGRIAPAPASRETFREARLMTGNLPVVPTREALSASSRPANLGAVKDEPVKYFVKRQVDHKPQPFEKQAAKLEQAIQQDGKFSPMRAQEENSQASKSAVISPANAGAASDRGIRSGAGEEEWRRFRTEVAENQRGQGAAESQGSRKAGDNADRKAEGEGKAAGRGGERNAESGGKAASSGEAKPARQVEKENGGWHKFSGPKVPQPRQPAMVTEGQPASRGERATPAERSVGGAAAAEAGGATRAAPASGERNEGWQRFERRPGGDEGSGSRREAQGGERSAPAGGEWNRSAPGGNAPGSSGGREARETMRREPIQPRPPLDLRQPIVMPRESRPAAPPAPARSGGESRPAAPPSGGGRPSPPSNPTPPQAPNKGR